MHVLEFVQIIHTLLINAVTEFDHRSLNVTNPPYSKQAEKMMKHSRVCTNLSTHVWFGYFHISLSLVHKQQLDFFIYLFIFNLASPFLQTAPSLNHQWCDKLDLIRWLTGCKAQVKNHSEPGHIVNEFISLLKNQKSDTLCVLFAEYFLIFLI